MADWQQSLENLRNGAALIEQAQVDLAKLHDRATAEIAKYLRLDAGADLDLDAIKATLTRPYTILPINEHEAWLIHWRGVRMPIFGWVVAQEAAFTKARVTRSMDLLTPLPAWMKQELGWKPPEHSALIDGTRTSLRITRGDEAGFRRKYGKHLGARQADGTYKIRGGDAWIKLVAQLVRDGILPYAPQPVAPEHWDAKATSPIVLRSYQQPAVAAFREKGAVLINFPPGAGKAQPLDAKVLTPSGWKRMQDLSIGDAVIDPLGGWAHVSGVFPQGVKRIYRVTFSDGSATECCEDHLWLTQNSWQRRDWLRGKLNAHSAWAVRNLRTVMQDVRTESDSRLNYSIPLTQPVEFTERDPLPLDPYLVGVLIGDGHLGRHITMLTTADIEIANSVRSALPSRLELVHWPSASPCDFTIVQKQRRTRGHPVRDALQAVGLIGVLSRDKFIPDAYKFASIANRTALLQGLLDTDGSVPGDQDHACGIEYATSSARLADDVRFLVRSLGGTATISSRSPHFSHRGEKRIGALAYRVQVKVPEGIQPFRLGRKVARYAPAVRYVPRRYIASVEYVADKPAQCISVDSESGLYVTDDFIVTHNTYIALDILNHFRGRVLLLADTTILTEQWRDRVKTFAPMADVTISTYQGAGKYLDREWDLLIPDEAQRLPANTFSKLAFAKAKYRLGLTGTPWREDDRTHLITALSGFPVAVRWSELINSGVLKRPRIVVATVSTSAAKTTFTKQLVARRRGRAIIFCDWIDQGQALADELDVPFIHGETKRKLEALQEADVAVVSRIGDRGLDLPDLKLVIEVAGAGAAREQFAQRVGRLLHGAFEGEFYTIFTPEEAAKYRPRIFGVESELAGEVEIEFMNVGDVADKSRTSVHVRPTRKTTSAVAKGAPTRNQSEVDAALGNAAVRKLVDQAEGKVGVKAAGYVEKAIRLAWELPVSLEELRAGKGVGEEGMKRYRAGFREAVAAGLVVDTGGGRYLADRGKIKKLIELSQRFK